MKLSIQTIFYGLFVIIALLTCCNETETFIPDLESDFLSLQILDSIKNVVIQESNCEEDDKLNARLMSAINYAPESSLYAESTFPGYSVNNINDGDRNTTVGPTHSWVNNQPGGGGLPESVTLTFSSSKTIDRIDLYSSSGYVLKDYTIQYKGSSSGSWSTLLSINGNTMVYRNHTFSKREILAVKIICKRGPDNQYIYGRINEIEIYGYVPTLPVITTVNGMLSFNNEADVLQTLDYLEYMYGLHDDNFLAQYGNYSDDDIGDIEEMVGYDDEQPYKDFEQQFNLSSKRSELSNAENLWLDTTDSEYPNQDENPDYNFIQDDEIRTIINIYGEIKVNFTFYKFNSDGSYYEVPTAYYSELVELRNIDPSSSTLPPHVILNNSFQSIIIQPLSCRASKRNRNHKRNGNWKFDYITSIWNHPWRSRIMAKTKSYKKKNNNRWKKRRTTIAAQVWGNVQDKDCDFAAFLESDYKQKRRKKVKSYRSTGQTIRAFSGDIHSYHYSSKVFPYTHTFTF